MSIKSATVSEALASMERARAAGADLAELRIDFMRDPDLIAAVDKCVARRPLPVVVTVRPAREGGAFSGDEAFRLRLLHLAVERGAEYVDVEVDAEIPSNRSTKVVVSHHVPDRFPSTLDEIVERMNAARCDVVKVAVRCESLRQVLELHRLRSRFRAPSVLIPMGGEWSWYRILHRRWGDAICYCALESGAETAEGQPSIADMVGLYRASAVTEKTKVYGLLGNPIHKSRSPALFNRLFREREMDAVYVPLPLQSPDGLREWMDLIPLSGMSVTIPHKRDALRFLDDVPGEIREIGAVNTVVKEGERWTGANTDVDGAMGALLPAVREVFGNGLDGKRALIIGYGGAARAIAWGLRREGASVGVTGRNPERVRAFTAAAGCAVAARGERYDVMINATPVGDRLPIPELRFARDQVVMDCIYTEGETELLRRARAAGAAVVPGEEMFYRQAARQVKLFTGLDIPPGGASR